MTPASEVLLEDFLEEGVKASEQGSCSPEEGRAGPAKRGTCLSSLFCLSVLSLPHSALSVCCLLSSRFCSFLLSEESSDPPPPPR